MKMRARRDCALPKRRRNRSGRRSVRAKPASKIAPALPQGETRRSPFLCTYMGRTSNGRKPSRFLWNQSAALASNLYLLLFPKGPLQAALHADSQLFPAVFQALRQIDTDAFIREGRVYGGGLCKME